jgi:hypothetical protein
MNRFHCDERVGITYEWEGMDKPWRSKPEFSLSTLSGKQFERPDGRRTVFHYSRTDTGRLSIRARTRRMPPHLPLGAKGKGPLKWIGLPVLLFAVGRAEAGQRGEVVEAWAAPSLKRLEYEWEDAPPGVVLYAASSDLASAVDPIVAISTVYERSFDNYLYRHAPMVDPDAGWAEAAAWDQQPEERRWNEMKVSMVRRGPAGMWLANFLSIPEELGEGYAEKAEQASGAWSRFLKLIGWD